MKNVKERKFSSLVSPPTSAFSLMALVLLSSVGCQSVGDPGASRRWWPGLPFTSTSEPEPAVQQASATQAKTASVGGNRFGASNRLVGYVTGTHEDLPRAQELYKKGDAMFREASRASKAERAAMFADAAKQFKKASKEAPGSALQQDALFMQGEAMFFANDLNGARDAFESLQKDFPRNRHSDRAAARLFSISKYWIDYAKAGGDAWYALNLFDPTRPMRDADGHAIRVLDQIRYDDPTGKLADDATMAAAAEYIRREEYEMADEFLTDLRETFGDSNHLFLAHLLGIRCKLEIYAGPRYSERVLDEADQLVQQTRRRFPNELKEKKYSDLLARASAEIAYHQAEKLAFRARYREKQHQYGAARELYRKLLRDHPTTPQAKEAGDVLAKIETLPASPNQPLAFLTKVFPSARRSTPLVTVESQQATESTEEAPESEPEAPTETEGERILR